MHIKLPQNITSQWYPLTDKLILKKLNPATLRSKQDTLRKIEISQVSLFALETDLHFLIILRKLEKMI